MKRIICAIFCLALLLGMAVPAMAVTVISNVEVYFTDDSNFEVGGTVTVDEYKIMDDGDIMADAWNAILEGRVQYFWYRNDSFYQDGESITLTDADKGCQFYCQAALYEDMDRTQQFGTMYSVKFTVPNGDNSTLIPEITTDSLPEGTVGQDYYFKLECTDADVVFSLFRSSLPDGLYLTQHGEIEGTPTEAGFWYVVVMATPVELGEDYATTAEFEFYINEADDYCELELMREPDKWQYVSGETLDLTGLWVRIWTSDGYKDSYDGEGLTYPTNQLITVGDQKIKVSYGEAFVIFMVVVEPAPEDPTEEPTETETEEPTEAATEVVTDEGAVMPGDSLTTGVQNGTTEDPTEEEMPETLDGPGYEGVFAPIPVWVWILLGIAALAVIAVPVLIVLLVVSKRKKG